MSSTLKPRHDYIDIATTERVLQNGMKHRDDLKGLMAAEPATLLQTRFNSLGSECEQIALLLYALGHPIERVREMYRDAVIAYEEVVRLRGTEPVFPVAEVSHNPAFSSADPRGVKIKSLNAPDEKDYSLGNSWDCYHFACVALMVGQADAAERFAVQAWDPPGSKYLGYGKYSVCTTNDQRLAYAMRKFYEKDRDGALRLVSMIGPTKGEKHDVVDQAVIWKGILQNQPAAVLDGLMGLLAWHRSKVKIIPNWATDYFICASALGLTAIAIQTGLIQKKQVPNDDVFFPFDFLSESRPG